MSNWNITPSKVYETAKQSVVIPCKNCKRRQVGCHSACEEYGAYKQELKDLHENVYNKYMPERLTSERTILAIQKARRHKERYKWG